MVVTQALFDARGLLRNGEQLLLTLIIPVLLLSGFSEASVLNLGNGSRVDFLTPGIIALAIMSTAFASQAIATGFERRYGVLKRLGAHAAVTRRACRRPHGHHARHRGAATRGDHRGGVRARLAAAWRMGRGCGRAVARASGHRGVQRPRPADGRDAAGRGDPRRRQPRLPDAARPRRGDVPAVEIPCRNARRARTAAHLGALRRAALCAAARNRAPWRDLAILAVWAIEGWRSPRVPSAGTDRPFATSS